jgi:hypothetical protein
MTYQELNTTVESRFAVFETESWNTSENFGSKLTDDFRRDILEDEIITTNSSSESNNDYTNCAIDAIHNYSSITKESILSGICQRSLFFTSKVSSPKQNLLSSWLSKTCEYNSDELLVFTGIYQKSIRNLYNHYFSINYENLYEDLDKIIKSLYAFIDFNQVNTHIRESARLQFLLVETFYKLQEYFGNEAEFVLDYQIDNYDNGSKQLFIRVSTKMTLENSLDKLDSFESDWYIERTAYILESPVVTLTK